MEKKKSNIKSLLITALKSSLLIVLFAAIVLGVVWSNHIAASKVCTDVKVNVLRSDSVILITPATIISAIEKSGVVLIDKPLSEINTFALERSLDSNDYIEDASCIILSDGSLIVEVKQMIPVMRVFDHSGASFYFNSAGKCINANGPFHMDVPIMTGVSKDDSLKVRDCLSLANFINDNADIAPYVTAVDASDSNNVLIVPNIRGHVINIGNINQGTLANKFAKIKQLYSRVIPHCGWWMYDTITVKWKHQIVASRRNTVKVVEPVFTDDDDEIFPDISSVIVSTAESDKTITNESKLE